MLAICFGEWFSNFLRLYKRNHFSESTENYVKGNLEGADFGFNSSVSYILRSV